jgi:hypothetical protein
MIASIRKSTKNPGFQRKPGFCCFGCLIEFTILGVCRFLTTESEEPWDPEARYPEAARCQEPD